MLKLGQLASCRVDLLPPAYLSALSRLQDRVPPLPAATIRARIEAELGAPIDQLFARFFRTTTATTHAVPGIRPGTSRYPPRRSSPRTTPRHR